MGKAKKGSKKASVAKKGKAPVANKKASVAKKGKAPVAKKKTPPGRKRPAVPSRPAKKASTARTRTKPAPADRVTPEMLDELANRLDTLLPSEPTPRPANDRETAFRRAFGDHAVPTLLARLLEFDAQHPGVNYAPEFAIYTTPANRRPGTVFDQWFSTPTWRRGGTDLIRFGTGVADGMIALWLYPGRSIETAPVVYLDSAGVGNGVVAGDLREYFALLATNRPFNGWEGDEPDYGDPMTTIAAANSELRHWLRSALRIDPAVDPITTTKAARGRHPDFQAWVSTLRAPA